ncbi:class I SAM-dependent methyltransferase [Desulfovibrio sp. OttesenSCG-928-G11]|nr:class I SAM-dependent methyltransferase [Desulfovibrio sp. OttesenSCG-928-G11]
MRPLFSVYCDGRVPAGRILEIGPGNNPIFYRSEGDVHYADVRNAAEVDDTFFSTDKSGKQAVELDFVIKGSYAASLKDVEVFDHVILCHVLEHIPRLIAFFQDIIKVMCPGGLLYLILPDHRFCFDHFRQPTSFAEAYYVHINKLAAPPWRVFDSHFLNAGYNIPSMYWNEKNLAQAILLQRRQSLQEARQNMEEAEKGLVSNSHVSVFTPWSFLLFLFSMLRVRMAAFSCERFFTTQKNEFSFGAVLKADPGLPRDQERLDAELKKLAALMDEQAPLPPGI